ncbi:MAG: succinate dehydrogenase/fumarate reductase iron-sulfur subunit [Proteobacteria bacterium]|jgi:fumarate reductase iron-sulfur subunit|nr:succinate dehydrogenase/fumarate reductase iron-sulfur subunit [Pseudomonadota bacterium]
MDNKIKKISILRYFPEVDEEPHFESYEVPFSHETSVLDALNYIRDNVDPSLSYRSSCRMAVCGSCAIMVNHVPKLACKTFIREYDKSHVLTLEPLENFPIERDLVTDISDMIAKLESVEPHIHPQKDAPSNQAGIQTPRELEKYRQFAQCTHCGCCYAACPQYKLHPDFIGPAALTLLYRYNHDSRDKDKSIRKAIMGQEIGVWRCTSVGYCSDVCPKCVDPASAIQIEKEENAFDYVKHFFKKLKRS